MMGEGTVNDEELVEVIYDSLLSTVASPLEFATNGESPLNDTHLMDAAKEALAALRSAGFQVHRPEDASPVVLHPCCTQHDGQPMCSPDGPDVGGNGECAEFLLPAGDYLLVPADSGGSG